jgi:hypothetical protein
MLAAGVHPKVASERLGHGKVGITLDLYSHVLPGNGRFAESQPVPRRVVLLAKFLTPEPSRAPSSHALLPGWVAKG